MRGWLPFRWRKQFVQVEHAAEFVVEFVNETTPVSAFGTGTPPLRNRSLFGAVMPLPVTVVPTGLGVPNGQFIFTPLSE